MNQSQVRVGADEFEIRIKYLIKNIMEDGEQPTIEIIRGAMRMTEISFMHNLKRLIREGAIAFENGIITTLQ